jgi:hypothetical protein
MALSRLSGSIETWLLASRPGTAAPGALHYTALVSDLATGDYLPGPDVKIVSTGATTAGVRALTVENAGVQFTVNWVAASAVSVLR